MFITEGESEPAAHAHLPALLEMGDAHKVELG